MKSRWRSYFSLEKTKLNFKNVDANILLEVCDVWFEEAARYNEDEKIQINTALIWVLHPRNTHNTYVRIYNCTWHTKARILLLLVSTLARGPHV